MRVIAGDLGGRRLRAPAKGSAVRPATDRVREAVFSMLGDVSGRSVLDLFCGTGAYGIEALSRGARRCVFVDVRPELARGNVDALGLADRAEIARADAEAFLRRTRRRYDLVFCDPPYAGGSLPGGGEVGGLIAARLADHGTVVAEGPSEHPLEMPLRLVRERTYGASTIRIYGRPDRSGGG